jgi:hypothetical protein
MPANTTSIGKIAAILFFGCVASACSKTVEWDEEVRLNSGATIWIHRSDSFKRSSEPGNPLKPAWSPGPRTYDFSWSGVKYHYETSPNESSGAMALRIEPDNTPSIIDRSRSCEKAGLAQWRWVNKQWVATPNAPSASLGTTRNLMSWYSADAPIPRRATME